jgi:hypothetical protein
MVLALAVIVTLGVGAPIAAWSWTRLRPPPAPSRLGTGYDPIDRWLLRRHSLAPIDRELVRAAVFEGRQVATRNWHSQRTILLTRCLAGKSEAGRYRPCSDGSTCSRP